MSTSQLSLTKGGLENLSLMALSVSNFLREGVAKGTALPLEENGCFSKNSLLPSCLAVRAMENRCVFHITANANVLALLSPPLVPPTSCRGEQR